MFKARIRREGCTSNYLVLFRSKRSGPRSIGETRGWFDAWWKEFLQSVKLAWRDNESRIIAHKENEPWKRCARPCNIPDTLCSFFPWTMIRRKTCRVRNSSVNLARVVFCTSVSKQAGSKHVWVWEGGLLVQMFSTLCKIYCFTQILKLRTMRTNRVHVINVSDWLISAYPICNRNGVGFESHENFEFEDRKHSGGWRF